MQGSPRCSPRSPTSPSSRRAADGAEAVRLSGEHRARRGADGRAHAGDGRDRGDPADLCGRRRRRPAHPDPDDLRPRRVRLRRPARRRERVPAQGRSRRDPLRGSAGHRRRRGAARPCDHAPPDRRVRPPPPATADPTGRARGADAARDRDPGARRGGPVEPRDRRAGSCSATRPSRPTSATCCESWGCATARRRSWWPTSPVWSCPAPRFLKSARAVSCAAVSCACQSRSTRLPSTSRMPTIPSRCSPSTTGRWRIFFSPISLAASRTAASASTVNGLRVITSPIRTASRSVPLPASASSRAR